MIKKKTGDIVLDYADEKGIDTNDPEFVQKLMDSAMADLFMVLGTDYEENKVMLEFFPNGFGISVIKDFNNQDKYEIAVIFGNPESYALTADTPVTNTYSGTVGNLTYEEMMNYYESVKNLPDLPKDAYVSEDGLIGYIPSWCESKNVNN